MLNVIKSNAVRGLAGLGLAASLLVGTMTIGAKPAAAQEIYSTYGTTNEWGNDNVTFPHDINHPDEYYSPYTGYDNWSGYYSYPSSSYGYYYPTDTYRTYEYTTTYPYETRVYRVYGTVPDDTYIWNY
jgi:hypothetical protein